MLSLVALLSFGVGGAFAELIPGETADDLVPYASEDILHAFDNMDLFVILDDNHHLVVNKTAANTHSEIFEMDVAIAYDFAVHNNEMIDALKNGPVGNVDELGYDNPELSIAIHDFKNGKFSKLFDHGDFKVKTTSLDVDASVIYPTYTNMESVDTFGMNKIVPVYHSAFGTVCGGGFFDHHNEPPEIPKGFFQLRIFAVNALLQSGHSLVPVYATGLEQFGGNYGDDYAKVASAYGCNDGEFRDQVVIKPRQAGYYHNTQGPEPNPEVFSYDPPAVWWRTYVLIWHSLY